MNRKKETSRAVFYARVSTEEERQVNALVKQIEECELVVKEQGWDLVDQYVDEGKSGTQTRKRDEYNRLLDDLVCDKFDIVVIKSQDRLMRSAKDWYIFIDRLVMSNKRLYMYLEGNFYTPDNSLITGIKAILAEEYSRDLSKKINNANRRRLEKAREGKEVSVYCTNNCYGYNIKDGKQFINEKEAEVVRLIYKLYLEGNGCRVIRRILTANGIRNHNGDEMNQVTVANILKNEKYTGTLVTNKTRTSFETKKTVKNPENEWVKIPNVLPAIVSSEDYEKVQQIFSARRIESGTEKRAVTVGKNVGKNPLSGKMFCANCGSVFWRKRRTDNSKVTWVCSTYAKFGKKVGRKNSNDEHVEVDSKRGCDAHVIYDDIIMETLTAIAGDLTINKEAVKKDTLVWLNKLIDNLSSQKDNVALSSELNKQKKLKDNLLEAMLEEIISKDDYKSKVLQIDKRIKELSDNLAFVEKQHEGIEEIKRVINNIDQEIDEWIAEDGFNTQKVDFILDHLKRIVIDNSCFIIELDIFKGALLAGKDYVLYVKEDTALL